MAEAAEQEILDARRAFATAQQLLAGGLDRRLPDTIAVGWYDTTVSPETGSFALVRRGGPYEDLIGDILRVSANDRSAFVYVLDAAGLPTDIAIARRAFLALARLATETLDCIVEVIS